MCTRRSVSTAGWSWSFTRRSAASFRVLARDVYIFGYRKPYLSADLPPETSSLHSSDGELSMRVLLADLKSSRGFVSKDTVVGGYGSRLEPFSFVTRMMAGLKQRFHDVPSVTLG